MLWGKFYKVVAFQVENDWVFRVTRKTRHLDKTYRKYVEISTTTEALRAARDDIGDCIRPSLDAAHAYLQSMCNEHEDCLECDEFATACRRAALQQGQVQAQAQAQG